MRVFLDGVIFPVGLLQLSNSFLKAEPISWIMSEVVVDLPCRWKAWLLHCLVSEQAPNAATSDGFTLREDTHEDGYGRILSNQSGFAQIHLHLLTFPAAEAAWAQCASRPMEPERRSPCPPHLLPLPSVLHEITKSKKVTA